KSRSGAAFTAPPANWNKPSGIIWVPTTKRPSLSFGPKPPTKSWPVWPAFVSELQLQDTSGTRSNYPAMLLCIQVELPIRCREQSRFDKNSMASDLTNPSHEAAEESSASSSSSSNRSPLAIPKAVWPGMTLNWGSPLRGVILHAELPFWLLVADCSVRVTVRDCTVELSITGRGIEIQRGIAYKDSHSNTAV